MKKSLLLTLMLVFVLVLAACSKENKSEPVVSASPTTEVKEEATAADPEPAPTETAETAPAEVVYTVVVTDQGAAALNLVKTIRDELGLGLAEAKELVDNIPSVIGENLSQDEAEALKAKIEEVGATVELQSSEKVEVVATGIKLVLTDDGDEPLEVVKAIRELLDTGLLEAKAFTDNMPSVLIEDITEDEANALKVALESVGATVEIQK